ncbi:MAG: CDP-alcohol phosphatidyltransferase family protein [Methylacidiphilales bacterium]|nr:CDP-alcohol phosphatidyltransferase family protein [Candidatus Methylacidiphilales bacterium]MDW8349286.1 CDP-alcohol phosphatidyltransferase family protein [Verrucomicrobiae bacterium]
MKIKMTWANRITLFRLILIPVFITFMLYYAEASQNETNPDLWRWLALTTFVLAAVSDAIDGYLARHFNQFTPLGSVLDPIADKLLMLSAVLTLSFIHIRGGVGLPLWFPVIIISRDIFLLIGSIIVYLTVHGFDVKPHWTGKWATFFQLTAIIAALMGYPHAIWICLTAALFTVISTCFYVAAALRLIASSPYYQTVKKD